MSSPQPDDLPSPDAVYIDVSAAAQQSAER
jgi:hypothetical protein